MLTRSKSWQMLTLQWPTGRRSTPPQKVFLVNGESYYSKLIYVCRYILRASVNEKIFKIEPTVFALKLDKGKVVEPPPPPSMGIEWKVTYFSDHEGAFNLYLFIYLYTKNLVLSKLVLIKNYYIDYSPALLSCKLIGWSSCQMDQLLKMHIDQQWSMPQNSQKTSESYKTRETLLTKLVSDFFFGRFQKIGKSIENVGKMILD